ncbi:MAG: hypothetical protein GY832_17810 [Chloroflexi bacterium]|nr:hypothetical protein [Chloroflexota bacterium]
MSIQHADREKHNQDQGLKVMHDNNVVPQNPNNGIIERQVSAKPLQANSGDNGARYDSRHSDDSQTYPNRATGS